MQQPLDTVIIADGKVDMYAHTYENGEYVREKKPFDGKEPGTFVEMEAHSVQEFFAEVMADSSEDPNQQFDSADAQRKMGFALLHKVSKSDGFHIMLNGMDHVNENSYTYAENYVPVMRVDGKWDIVPTAEWQITGVSTKDPNTYADVAFGVWYGKNGGRVMVLEGEYLANAKNISDYWKTHDRNAGVGLNRPLSD